MRELAARSRAYRRILALTVFVLVCTAACYGQSIELDVAATDAWLREQVITGVASAEIESGTLSVGSRSYAFQTQDGTFAVQADLDEGLNVVTACSGSVCSDTSKWTLRYTLHPEVYAFGKVSGRQVSLQADILESPNGEISSYSWSADGDNPINLTVQGEFSSTGSVSVPEDAPHGEYYFDVTVTDITGREGQARTFITVDSTGVRPFDIWSDHASWVDDAVVYEVTPYIFEGDGDWSDVTARLDEISELGVNTLWIQPVMKTHGGGQGYDITNYFEIRTDLGTEDDLRELVRSAKEDFDMRVLFDFVPNHTSIEHPYARDVASRGVRSHYYSYFLTEPDNAAYSQHYHADKEPFIYYFWEDLVIIDWSNPEVYRWMMEAGQRWVEDFGIDGYRIDAVWGVNARTPEAMQNWRFDLKRIKPEIFLLGEDKATWPSSFDKRFDAAYDWYPEEDWVSHWTWQTHYSATENHTIFNSQPEGARSERLRAALTNNGSGWHPDAKVFRFLQNNDTFPFIESHGLRRTEMAASLLFALPGIPMIYNGQEIGHDRHPYETWQIFSQGESIRDQDPYGLYEHYQDLTAIRNAFPVLRSDTYEEVSLDPSTIQSYTFAFRRWLGDRHILGIINMGSESVRARINLPLTEMSIDDSRTHYLTDLLGGESRAFSGAPLRYPIITVDSFSTRIFMLADYVVETPTGRQVDDESIPADLLLSQNYPNPFNSSTQIVFELPQAGEVKLRVFDVLGREIATLVNDHFRAGKHVAYFNGQSLASGVYFYRLDTGTQSLTRQMLLTK